MSLTRPRTDPAPTPPQLAAAATRIDRPGWRDPRVIAGLVLVAISVLSGARLLASADDTVPVWSVRRAVPAGAVLAADDLTRRAVRLDDDALSAYVTPGMSSPVGRRALRAMGPGELVPRTVLREADGPAEIEVPLSVARENVPGGVRPGAVVDVWVVPAADGAAADQRPEAVRSLDRVRVVEAPRRGDALAPQATRAVVVAVAADQDLGRILAAMVEGRVVLTLRAPA